MNSNITNQVSFFIMLSAIFAAIFAPATAGAEEVQEEYYPAIKFSVFYEIDAPWDNATNLLGIEEKDSEFAALIESFGLHIMEYNDLDEETRILELRPRYHLDSPVDLACKLSLIDYIIMVHIEHIPKTED